MENGETLMMQWDGKAHNHFMVIVQMHLAFSPKIHIKVCTNVYYTPETKKSNVVSVTNQFFLNLLYE